MAQGALLAGWKGGGVGRGGRHQVELGSVLGGPFSPALSSALLVPRTSSHTADSRGPRGAPALSGEGESVPWFV